MKLISAILSAALHLVSAIVVPGADTPVFYLVATGPDSAGVNFLPVRLNGGTANAPLLTGTGPIGKFYFYQGSLVAADPNGSPITYRPLISPSIGANGCNTFGQLGFVQGASTNKCARYSSFQIQSNQENSQLGAKLVFNYVGGFYVCGAGKELWYKINVADGPTSCTPVELYTLPVVQ